MKICLINDTVYPYFVGGAPKRVWEIAKRLAQRDHQVHWFGMKYWDGEDIIPSMDVYLHGVYNAQEIYIKGKRSIKQALYFSYKLLRPLLREKFDIIDCSNFPYFPCFAAKLHSILKGSKYVVTWHEVWDKYWYEYLGKKGVFGLLVERLLAHSGNNMIVVSERTKDSLSSVGYRGNSYVVNNGIDYQEINSVSAAEEHSDVICASKLLKHKNIDLLIKSIALLKNNMKDIECKIIGDGPERSWLEQLVRDLDLTKNVFFLGLLNDSKEVFSHFKSSKVFALPSMREGFGIVFIEANACGLPIITIKNPQTAAGDLIVNGDNGYICDNTEEDLASKILSAIDKSSDMRPKCILYAQQYDWNRIVDQVEAVYKSICSDKSRNIIDTAIQ